MTMHRNLLMFVTLAYLMGRFGEPSAQGAANSQAYPPGPIAMRVAIDIDAQRYFVGENFPITVHILNPNAYDVYLAGFEFGALEPHTEILFPAEEEFQDFSRGGTVDVIGGPPVRVPARGQIEHRRLVYIDTRLDQGHWVLMPAGVYRLRMKSPPNAVRPNEPARYKEVDWSLQVVEFTLALPGGRDLVALEFLREKVRELAQHQREPTAGFATSQFELRFYRQFLERFPNTIYAPEIRWRVARSLQRELASNCVPEEELPEMLDLWEECLTFCLEREGAFSEEFLWWDMDRGGNSAVDLARIHRRLPLLKRIVRDLDRRCPGDEEAVLYRQVMVVGETDSVEKARRIAATLAERFPESKYTRRAEHLIDWIQRQKKRD